MKFQVPRKHHYVPQFYLRNFASDPERKKITTVSKHGHVAIWAERSIKSLGYEKDLYVSMQHGVPISVETQINEKIETPISKSDTWQKVASGKSDSLDQSDRAIIYSLVQHLHVRTPHHMAIAMELANLAQKKDSGLPFTDFERERYAHLRAHPEEAKALFNIMSMSTEWMEDTFHRAAISIVRSPIPLKTASVPVIPIRAPSHPALYQPLPGLTPYQLCLPLDPFTFVSVVLGDFDGNFLNFEMDVDTARGFNRYYVAQFSYYSSLKHLVTGRDGLSEDMAWAQYDCTEDTPQKIRFSKRT